MHPVHGGVDVPSRAASSGARRAAGAERTHSWKIQLAPT